MCFNNGYDARDGVHSHTHTHTHTHTHAHTHTHIYLLVHTNTFTFKVLYMTNNKVKDWKEFEELKNLPELVELNFVGE